MRARQAALAVLCLCALTTGLDMTIVNLALPFISRELHASTSDLQWVIDSYNIVIAGLLVLGGGLADRYGREIVFFSGFALFGLACLLAAFSDSSEALIAWRALMGVGAAGVVAPALASISVLYPPEERAPTIAAFAAFAGEPSAAPLFDVRILRRRAVSAGSITLFTAYWVFTGMLCLFPTWLQDVRHESIITVGLLLVPFAAVFGLSSMRSSAVVARLRERQAITAGCQVCAVSAWRCSASSCTSTTLASVLATVVLTLGMSELIAPPSTVVMNALPEEEAGDGSSLNMVSRFVGAAIGVAVVGSVFAAVQSHELDSGGNAALAFDAGARRLLDDGRDRADRRDMGVVRAPRPPPALTRRGAPGSCDAPSIDPIHRTPRPKCVRIRRGSVASSPSFLRSWATKTRVPAVELARPGRQALGRVESAQAHVATLRGSFISAQPSRQKAVTLALIAR